jgi:hypothetical protein
MDPIAALKETLARHPELKFVETATGIFVEAPSDDGFKVSFQTFGDEHIVHFDGWHEHFSSLKDAMDCFAFGLSGRARLAITYRGTTPVKWVLEHLVGEQWNVESETGRLLAPFWKATKVVYKRNPGFSTPHA